MKSTNSLVPLVIATCVLLAGCQTPPPITGNLISDRPVTAPTSGGFDWNWDISGDQAIRPVQVFSNADKTWIQMTPHQAMPAIFVAAQPVPFEIHPPYLTIQGAPSRIDLIATNYRAVITKRSTADGPEQPMDRSISKRRIESVEIKE